MSDLPYLSIVLLTYKRTGLAVRTVLSTCENLVYPKELVGWYVADDGSSELHFSAVMYALNTKNAQIIGAHNERLRAVGHEDTYHSGAGWNRGLGLAHQKSDYVLMLEDDWELREPLHIMRYMMALRDHEDIGLMRLGTLAKGNLVEVVGVDGVHYLKYVRGRQYCYSGNPNIRHARFTRAYGNFAEDRNPGEIELEMDYKFQSANGPDILRPAEINPWGAWAHIGTEKSYA